LGFFGWWRWVVVGGVGGRPSGVGKRHLVTVELMAKRVKQLKSSSSVVFVRQKGGGKTEKQKKKKETKKTPKNENKIGGV